MSSRCKTHVNDSIEKVDEKSWLIAKTLLLSRQSTSAPGHPSWSDGEDGFLVLTDAPTSPLPQMTPHPPDSPIIPRVYAVGDQAAVWRAGEAFIKAHDIAVPAAAREHITLRFVHGKQPLDFNIPQVLYHTELDDRYFLILTRVPGETLDAAWPNMDDAMRDYYASCAAEICDQMAAWEGTAITRVDGNLLHDNFPPKMRTPAIERYNPENYLKSLQPLMDLSKYVFYHRDQSPSNIIIEPSTK